MTEHQWQPTSETNLDGYGADMIPWERVRDVLMKTPPQGPGDGGPTRHTVWLTTINPDGTPHPRPLGMIVVDGRFYFTSGKGTRKSQNLAKDPRSTLTYATNDFDFMLEGSAAMVTDPEVVARVAEAYRAGEGWPAQVDETGTALTAEYSAQTAGKPPWNVFEFTPKTIYAIGTSGTSGGAGRWRF